MYMYNAEFWNFYCMHTHWLLHVYVFIDFSPCSEVLEAGASVGYPPDTRRVDLAKKMLSSVPSPYDV